MYQLYRKNGITLIALIVTIVTVIILTGLGISLIFGENGIIKKSKDARQLSNEAIIKQNIEFAIVDTQMERTNQKEELRT